MRKRRLFHRTSDRRKNGNESLADHNLFSFLLGSVHPVANVWHKGSQQEGKVCRSAETGRGSASDLSGGRHWEQEVGPHVHHLFLNCHPWNQHRLEWLGFPNVFIQAEDGLPAVAGGEQEEHHGRAARHGRDGRHQRGHGAFSHTVGWGEAGRRHWSFPFFFLIIKNGGYIEMCH